MSDVIDFFEKMGQDANWSNAPEETIEQALLDGGIDMVLQSAILANDQSKLELLMGLSPFCAMLDPGKEEEEEEQDPEESPSRENKEPTTPSVSILSALVG